MRAPTKWLLRVGGFCFLFAILEGLVFSVLGIFLPERINAFSSIMDFTVGPLLGIFAVVGFILLVAAAFQLRSDWNAISGDKRGIVAWALIATNLFGAYLYFLVRHRLVKAPAL
jgi:hypothetical protein